MPHPPLSPPHRSVASLTRDGPWWRASNEAYAEDDGSIDAYGLHFWTEAGGLTSGGCLWSIRDGEPVAEAWRMLQGWDGTRGLPFLYQHNAAGTTGMGWQLEAGPPMRVERTFRLPDGSAFRMRHRSSWLDDDTRLDETFTWSDGAWVEGRTYTWRRVTDEAAPSGPGRSVGG